MSETEPQRDPIFILGVPRSGTTLLRTILDSHSAIACGPETPWLGDHQPRSAMALWRALTDEPWGYCASFKMPREVATRAIARMIDELLSEHARARGKRRWAEKTPDNLLFIDGLAELFPRARFIHLSRGGLDVAISTASVSTNRKGISPWHEENLVIGSRDDASFVVQNTPFAALLRWQHWDRLISTSLAVRRHFHVRYEDLVTRPEPVLRSLCDFLDERFEPGMLEYARTPHEYPAWEWGSADVKAHTKITTDRVGRGERELTNVEREILQPLASNDGLTSPKPPAPRVSLARVDELESDRFRTFMRWTNAFAEPLGLRTFTNWSKVWEYPWLWFNALANAVHPGVSVVDLGSELSPMPWIAAMLGARVRMIETDGQFIERWTRLRDVLRVDVSWSIVESERLPIESASADIVTSFSVIEHQPDKSAAIDEAIRVLRPGGMLALSFDICEPSMGMAFPEWNGQALTMRDFETLLWGHRELNGSGTPRWNLDSIPDFLAWHKRSAPHHTYVTGAAVLRKS